MIVCLNGRFLRDRDAHISIFDHGFLYGDGLYETLRVENGGTHFLADHLRRLARGCRRLRLRNPWSNAELGLLIATLVGKNNLRDAVIRLTLTRGPGTHGLDPRSCKSPTLLITARAFDDYSSVRKKGGMRVALVDVRRNSANATPPDVKSISCLNGVLAKMESIDMRADEAVMLNERGHVTEGSVSNVFIVKNGVVQTPRLDGGQLPGVMRARVCRALRRLCIPIGETTLTAASLHSADEIFLTNVLMRVMPVRELVWKAEGRLRRRALTSHSVAQRLTLSRVLLLKRPVRAIGC